jgi:DNA-directed RNA polymerase specialized sigma24 family protein
MLGEGFSYDEACDALGIDSEKAFLCEMSWKEIHASFDYKPEDWREREFVYNDDEIKALLISDDIKDALISLDDKEMKLLLAYVDDQPLSEAEIEVAEKKLSVLREIARA